MTSRFTPPPIMSDEQATEIAASIVSDLHENFYVSPDGERNNSPELIDRHLSSIGDPSAMSSNGFAQQRVPIHPQIATALRENGEWGDALISMLRYAGDPEVRVVTISDRRRRLRRFINALNHSMGLHPDLAELEIRDDLAHLGLALEGLDVGEVHPLVRTPDGMGNRLPDTRTAQQFRVYVAAFCLILIHAGVKRTDAFVWVADELTKAGATSLKGKAAGKFGYSPETVKKHFYGAQPGADDTRRASEQARIEKVLAENETIEDEKKKLDIPPISKKRDGDAAHVARLIGQFVLHAQEEGQPLPPTRDYAEKVITRTINDPTFTDLIPMSA